MGLLATFSAAAPALSAPRVVCLLSSRPGSGVALPTLGIGFAAPAFALLTPVKIFTPAIVMLALATRGLLAATENSRGRVADLGRSLR